MKFGDTKYFLQGFGQFVITSYSGTKQRPLLAQAFYSLGHSKQSTRLQLSKARNWGHFLNSAHLSAFHQVALIHRPYARKRKTEGESI